MNEKPQLPDWATPEGYDRLILKRNPYTEKQVVELIKMLETDDAYGVYALSKSLSVAALEDMFGEFPQGKKTEYKRKVDDLKHQGREIMLEMVTGLEELIDQDDSLGISGILEEESDVMVKIITETLSPEHQEKLSIINQEAA